MYNMSQQKCNSNHITEMLPSKCKDVTDSLQDHISEYALKAPTKTFLSTIAIFYSLINYGLKKIKNKKKIN